MDIGSDEYSFICFFTFKKQDMGFKSQFKRVKIYFVFSDFGFFIKGEEVVGIAALCVLNKTPLLGNFFGELTTSRTVLTFKLIVISTFKGVDGYSDVFIFRIFKMKGKYSTTATLGET